MSNAQIAIFAMEVAGAHIEGFGSQIVMKIFVCSLTALSLVLLQTTEYRVGSEPFYLGFQSRPTDLVQTLLREEANTSAPANDLTKSPLEARAATQIDDGLTAAMNMLLKYYQRIHLKCLRIHFAKTYK
jgi:hypothetical protein